MQPTPEHMNAFLPGKASTMSGGRSPSSSSLQDLNTSGACTLPSLLPYKLLHAQMLAEYGRISDALAYCHVS